MLSSNASILNILDRIKRKVTFCDCQCDPVRLLRMGYLAASPRFPQTAFSLPLMRYHHILWKFCAIRVEPFARALDMFLDDNNPLLLSSKSMRVSGWWFHRCAYDILSASNFQMIYV